MSTPAPRMIIMGGTFDPPHLGHLIAARSTLEALGVDKITLMPASMAPLKNNSPATSPEHRLGMLQAMAKRWSWLEVNDLEIRKGGTNYTLDTVNTILSQNTNRRISWVIGADQLECLPQWHKIEELAKTIDFICAARPGHPLKPPVNIPLLRVQILPVKEFDISSSDIRLRLQQKLPVDFYLPEPVFHYIQQYNLYTF